jgi:hypothetical protein
MGRRLMWELEFMKKSTTLAYLLKRNVGTEINLFRPVVLNVESIAATKDW